MFVVEKTKTKYAQIVFVLYAPKTSKYGQFFVIPT